MWRNPASARAAATGESKTASPSARSTESDAEGAVADGEGEGVDGGSEDGRVVGIGQQRPAAPLDVQDEVAVDQHDHGAGLAAGPVASRTSPGRSGQGRAAPYGLAGSAAASTWVSGGSTAARSSARIRSTAPGSANWAPPSPSTKYPRRHRPASSMAFSTA